MSQANESKESALDRLGPAIVWIGLVVVLIVTVGVMIEGQVGFGASAPQLVAAPSH